MARNKKETVQFNASILAGTSSTLAYTIKKAGTVERIFGKFNAGQEGSLQVRPFLELTGQRQEELVTYPNGVNRFMSGEDTAFDFSVDFDVANGDQIKVTANNISTFDYTLNISFEVDYVGDGSRVI